MCGPPKNPTIHGVLYGMICGLRNIHRKRLPKLMVVYDTCRYKKISHYLQEFRHSSHVRLHRLAYGAPSPLRVAVYTIHRWLSSPHLTLGGQAGSTYPRIRIQLQYCIACASGAVTRTADRDSSRHRHRGNRRIRQLALDFEGNRAKSTHHVYGNTWELW